MSTTSSCCESSSPFLCFCSTTGSVSISICCVRVLPFALINACLGLPNWPEFGGRCSLFLVMKEYDCNLQSHCRNLRERGSLDERFLLTILLQLFKAINHLVKHNILHRDLKLDNVLLKLEPNMTRSSHRFSILVIVTFVLPGQGCHL